MPKPERRAGWRPRRWWWRRQSWRRWRGWRPHWRQLQPQEGARMNGTDDGDGAQQDDEAMSAEMNGETDDKNADNSPTFGENSQMG